MPSLISASTLPAAAALETTQYRHSISAQNRLPVMYVTEFHYRVITMCTSYPLRSMINSIPIPYASHYLNLITNYILTTHRLTVATLFHTLQHFFGRCYPRLHSFSLCLRGTVIVRYINK